MFGISGCSFFQPVFIVSNQSDTLIEDATIHILPTGDTIPLGDIAVNKSVRHAISVKQDGAALLSYARDGEEHKEIIYGYLTRGLVGTVNIEIQQDDTFSIQGYFRHGF